MTSLLLIALWSVQSKPLYFEIDAGTEECIHEDYAKGETIEFYFEVTGWAQPSSMDIELKIYGPQQNVMLQRMSNFQPEKSTEHTGEALMKVGSPGTHRICFNNKFSRWKSKIIEFNMRGSKS